MAEEAASSMLSVSPPATSVPRATLTPSFSSTRTGATPEQIFWLESGQWTAVTPASRMARRSRSSHQTQWAITVRPFHSPYLA